MPLAWTLPPPMPPPPVPRWELIGEPVLPVQADQPGLRLQPLSAEQVDVVVNSTPLQRNDFRPLLRLSPSVPTAMTLPEEQWRLHLGTISPFDARSNTDLPGFTDLPTQRQAERSHDVAGEHAAA